MLSLVRPKRVMNTILTLLKLCRWKGYLWLPGYFRERTYNRKPLLAEERDVHIIIAVADHFEPSRREGREGVTKVRRWCEVYENIVKGHCDSDGIPPQHTWFYRYDYPNYECIQILSEYVYRGLGEIEFHLHHGYDSAKSFAGKLDKGVAWFNEAGAMISAEAVPRKRFGYIAGNWALDNGRRDPSMSGVNTELSVLRAAGCYADFTFPAFGTNAQPRKVNSIYYAKDSPRPKSYNRGVDVKVGGRATGDLMIFQGPLYVDWKSGYLEYAAFEEFSPFFPRRVDYWLSGGVHVKGRYEWIIIKLSTHGMQSRNTFLSKQLDKMLGEVEHRFKSPPFQLHYVTAREAYNIVKAAEAGGKGNPSEYRDFVIKAPANKKIFCNQPYELLEYSKNRVLLKLDSDEVATVVKLKESPVSSLIGGSISKVELCCSEPGLRQLRVEGRGECVVSFRGANQEASVEGREKFKMPFDFGFKGVS